VIYKGEHYSIHVEWKNHLILVESTQQIGRNKLVGLDWAPSAVHVMLNKQKGNPNEFRF
jgi:ABC-type Fe3+/spermidine/putrescine transport system ATPase subunit